LLYIYNFFVRFSRVIEEQEELIMQLKVIKADGSAEEYMHTKVMGAINDALGRSRQADTYVAEELAEVVTFYLYNQQARHSVSSNEIFSVIKTILAATGYEEAAILLSEYHFERRLKRSRTEVIGIDIRDLTDAELLGSVDGEVDRSRWNKAVIIDDLEIKHGISRQTARTIASMVEEQVFNTGITQIPASLVRQLVLSNAAAVLRAQSALSGGVQV
jgi:transcriptional regulator NrdR family protein